jgi:hypothetical protein
LETGYYKPVSTRHAGIEVLEHVVVKVSPIVYDPGVIAKGERIEEDPVVGR